MCRLRALEPEDLEVMYGWENDMELWRKYSKEQAEITETAEKYLEYRKIEKDMKI